MSRLFWRLAYRRYRNGKPSRFAIVMAFLWAALFAVTWGYALAVNWAANADRIPLVLLLVGVPLCIGLALHKIRGMQVQNSSALYFKQLSSNG